MCGYWNEQARWVEAERVMKRLVDRCLEAGVSFITGKRGTVTSLVQSDGKIVGLKVNTGETIHCSRVILATGAWTSQILDLKGAAISTAQPVGLIQLTPNEATDLAKQPVVFDINSGVFVFPPSTDNFLKVMRHGYGYETTLAPGGKVNFSQSTSGPNVLSSSATSDFIPDEADASLREALSLLLPRFQNRLWKKRRLCWYSDTRDANFIIDHHPTISNLFLATGGSGQ
ncbi:hypothetical protein LT330_010686 [Penicillium expansum]|nr:hypothetical protein LT330_010686 [Penicillium expansum]